MHKPAVILRGIRKSYPLKNVLDNVNMTVDEGDLFAIIGPKGSGKTTVLKVILGLTRAQGGKVIFGPQYGGGLANGRAACASLMREPFIPGVTISRYLEKFPYFQDPEAKPKMRNAFQNAGFTMPDSRYRDLPAIEKRRLGIALALMEDPKILLLDNPFGGLDQEDARSMADLLRKLNREMGMTILFTTRNAEEAKAAADRVVFFEKGTASRVMAAQDL